MTHSSIEAIRELQAAQRIAPRDVTAIELSVNEGHFGVCNILEPRTGLEAKFSLRFTAAMALAGRDTSGIETYTDALTRDPELVALRDKVEVVAWPDARPETRARIRVGNESFEAATNVGIPLTDYELQWRKLTSKFHALVDPLLGRESALTLAQMCGDLEHVTDLAPFWRAIRGRA